MTPESFYYCSVLKRNIGGHKIKNDGDVGKFVARRFLSQDWTDVRSKKDGLEGLKSRVCTRPGYLGAKCGAQKPRLPPLLLGLLHSISLLLSLYC